MTIEIPFDSEEWRRRMREEFVRLFQASPYIARMLGGTRGEKFADFGPPKPRSPQTHSAERLSKTVDVRWEDLRFGPRFVKRERGDTPYITEAGIRAGCIPSGHFGSVQRIPRERAAVTIDGQALELAGPVEIREEPRDKYYRRRREAEEQGRPFRMVSDDDGKTWRPATDADEDGTTESTDGAEE